MKQPIALLRIGHLKTIGFALMYVWFLNTVKHMKECKATGTVIVPEWPSAAFWPTLSPKLGVFKNFFISHVILPNIQNLCTPGRGQCMSYKPGKRLFQGSLPFKLIVMRYDFNCHDLL